MLGAIAYCNSENGPFIFDDVAAIQRNPQIRSRLRSLAGRRFRRIRRRFRLVRIRLGAISGVVDRLHVRTARGHQRSHGYDTKYLQDCFHQSYPPVVQVNSQSRYTISRDSNSEGWTSNLANSCKTRFRTQGDRTATRFCSEHRARYTISTIELSVIDRQNFQQLSFRASNKLSQIEKCGALS